MKVAILTFCRTTNYGAAMQCYALSQYVREQGHEVVILNVPLTHIGESPSFVKRFCSFVLRMKRRLLNSPQRQNLETIRYSRTSAQRIEDARYDALNQIEFNKFNQRFLPPFTQEYKTEHDLLSNSPDVDLYIVGSDQVWNTQITLSQKDLFFFSFLKDKRRISYAASFGGSALWHENCVSTKCIKNLLQQFEAISVRESMGLEILNEQFDLDGTEVLDPTFLLDSYQSLLDYGRADAKGSVYTYKFILNDEWMKVICSIADALNAGIRMDCEVIKVAGVPFRPILGVEDWLRMINSSEFIVTDSFHCTVFCILFRKPFIVTPSYPGGEGRMLSLLQKLGLESRFYYTVSQFYQSHDKWKESIDYDAVHKKLTLYRKSSRDFLLSHLNLNN